MESFFIKSVGLDLYGVLSCEFCEMLLNSYSVKHVRTTASLNFCRLPLLVTLFKNYLYLQVSFDFLIKFH